MKTLFAFLLSQMMFAQTTPPRSIVSATGQGTVMAAPDQVKIDATVLTQSTTAQDAAAQNATRVAAVVAALQKLLGSNADIKTINYNLMPLTKYSNDGAPPTIVGYSASLTVEVTVGDPNQAGPIIDTAVGAGASSIGALQFGLKDPTPQKLQALKLATADAMSHASAMASGAGHTVGAIIALREGTTVVPVTTMPVGVAGGAAAPTQITPGLIQVTAIVSLDAVLN